jgi:NADH dehydrogenase
MILVTGGTGFIGSILVHQLTNSGYPVRLLIHPSKDSPNIPKSIPVEVAVASLSDERGIRAALKDVNIIYHLAGAERMGSRANLMQVEIEGSRTISKMAKEVSIERLIFLSHIGADRASAFPLLKAKGIAEHNIKDAGVDFTIIRSAIVFGEKDHFTNNLARLVKLAPGLMFLPGDGNTLIQPIAVEDLVTCLIWTLDLPQTVNQILEIGGPEYLSIKEVLLMIMNKIGHKRILYEINPVYLSFLTELFETFSSKFPTSVFWLDYLAENRICSLNSVPNIFNLSPTRFSHRIDYLKYKNAKIKKLR